MKRALAERAKQSETTAPPNGLLSPVQVPSGPGQPPRKLARIDEEQSPPSEEQQQVKAEPITVTVPSQVTGTTTSTTPRPSPHGTPREAE
jgi:hypothetical protein